MRQELANLVGAHGVAAVMAETRIAAGTLANALAGLPIRNGTLAQITHALADGRLRRALAAQRTNATRICASARRTTE